MVNMCGLDTDSRAVLVLAPHLVYPTRNGADIAVDRKWAEYSRYVCYVDIISRNAVTRYRDGVVESVVHYENAEISKIRAVIYTIARGSHYLLEKYVSSSFKSVAADYLARADYQFVLCSFIWTASVVGPSWVESGRLAYVETHNDEIKWFKDLGSASLNPLVRLVSWLSKRWLIAFMEKNQKRFIFSHVTQADFDGYSRIFPQHVGFVVAAGVDVPVGVAVKCSVKHGPVLIFAGSLSVKMNLDALTVFSSRFFPLIREAFQDNLEVLVVGSNPSSEVIKLCQRFGWYLSRNVSDGELEALYARADFSILPFDYVTGGKLKVLKSLALGIPFLGTSVIRSQVEPLIYPCLADDSPGRWIDRIKECMVEGDHDAHADKLREYAKQYSWPKLAGKMHLIARDFSIRM